MINITFKPNTYELEITGHAGHDVKGKDIVCAAVSTLFYTLGQALFDSGVLFEDEVVFKDEDGHGYIKAYTDRYNEYDVNAMFWTIITGFEMLANQYPENICFDVKNEG